MTYNVLSGALNSHSQTLALYKSCTYLLTYLEQHQAAVDPQTTPTN